MNKVHLFEKSYVSSIDKSITLPSVGDLIVAGLKIVDGNSSRTQDFEGICVGIHRCGVGTSILIKKDTSGIISLRRIPLYSPNLQYIKVLRSHKVRRAKLYYLLSRFGKRAKLTPR